MYVVMVMSWNQSTHCENLVKKIQYQLGIVCFGLGRPQYRDPSRHAGEDVRSSGRVRRNSVVGRSQDTYGVYHLPESNLVGVAVGPSFDPEQPR